MKRFACTVALLLTLGTMAAAQEGDAGRSFGPPAEVIAAWEAGDAKSISDMPPWVASMHELAADIGLPGPPPEVIEAWENGEGESLPGPPAFVLDILQMFWQ